MSTDVLFESQHSTMSATIGSRGVFLNGNLTLAAAINASFYALMTTVRENVTYSSSPGGLATNSYHGHTFWDVETWMWPNWNIFYPNIARSVLQYRVNRVPAAIDHAKQSGFSGTMFPWESAFTGSEVDPASGTTIEEHIQGDIAFAFYQHWMLTKDLNWLKKDGFNVIKGIAEFWVSKSVLNSDGTYSIPNIMGPDEYHGPVNDSVYCNVIAQMSLQAAYDLAPLVGQQSNATFNKIASNLIILFDETKQYHPEFEGYSGETVKQADTILLGYPLSFKMSSTVRKNDLEFYANVTDIHGPAMTWSMFSIGYKDIGLNSIAESYFWESFSNNINGDYLVWSEVIGGGGAQNFITGVGGFLQCLWAGYGGIRIHNDRLEISNPIPLPSTSSFELHGVSYLEHSFDMVVSHSTWTIKASSADDNDSPLFLQVEGGSSPVPITSTPISIKSGTSAFISAQEVQ
eukprot:m.18606 g.18606  ORF g.18606 m.18606 type:complete len:460 (+) comp8334_c0_seq2:55-1434(+)